MIKTEFLKASKQRIKKDIEFYKAAINKLVRILSSRHSSTISHLSDHQLHHYHHLSAYLYGLDVSLNGMDDVVRNKGKGKDEEKWGNDKKSIG